MAFKIGSFNADQVIEETKDLETDFEPIPAGEYTAMVVETEVKETNDGNGEYVKIKAIITSGNYKKRCYWDNFNVVNRSDMAVRLGTKMLAMLCKAVGRSKPDSLEDIHKREFRVKLKIQAGRGDYGPSNKSVWYKPLENARDEAKRSRRDDNDEEEAPPYKKKGTKAKSWE